MTNYTLETLNGRPFAEIRDIAKMLNLSVAKKNKATLINDILVTQTEETVEVEASAEQKAEKKQDASQEQKKAEAEEKKQKKAELKSAVIEAMQSYAEAHNDIKLSVCDNNTFFAVTKNNRRLFIVYNQSSVRIDVKRELLTAAENTADDVANCNNALNKAYKKKYADYRTLKEYTTITDVAELQNDIEALYIKAITRAEAEKKA